MMKYFIIYLIFTLSSIQALGSTVRVSDTTTPTVNVGNIYNVYNTMGGDGTSVSAPLKLYVPLSGTGTTQSDNHILKTGLFQASSTKTLNITTDVVNTSGSDTLFPTLYVKDGNNTGYLFVSRSSVGCATISTCEDLVSSFTIESICTSSEVDCTAALSAPIKVSSYLFLSKAADDLSINDPTSSTDGVFVELNISGRVYTGSVSGSLIDVEVGDERLKFNYSLSAIQNDYRDIAIFDVSSYDSKFGQAGIKEILSIDDDVVPYASGIFEAKNLQNDRMYNISFAVRDYYGFYTPLSPTLSSTPLKIAEFLEKNQCYFISAGFMKQHYVLDYFRHIRDSYILKVKFGQNFVDLYYKTAPQYVPFIIANPWLQAIVKGLAFFVYFLFNFGFYVFLFIVTVKLMSSYVFKFRIRE